MRLAETDRDELLALDVPAHLGWIDARGFPRITPLWFLHAEGVFYMTSTPDRPHVAGLTRRSQASICIDTEERVSVGGVRRNRQVKGWGHAKLFDDPDGEWTRRITRKYVNGREGEERASLRAAMPRIVIALQPRHLLAIGSP
jgi:nitroimidazol reductase NimA-like FMN-containing flavoprotein (pyridoxamine 5'-phosphate oxidase superfamily)